MYSNFQSQTELNAHKEEIRKARSIILEKAKKSYEHAEAKKEKARKEGLGTWMLDSVSQRIGKEEKEIEKAKKKKKKKKEKKDKKKKKHSRSNVSTSDDDQTDEQEWVETTTKTDALPGTVIKGPQLQRDSWMESPLDLIPTTSRQELRDVVKKQKDEAKKETEKKLAPGQHARELNPYWKDGGSGLPENNQEKCQHKTSSTSLPSSGSGDGGLSWLRTAYNRCKQQAQDEGRSLEEVAGERWGSLKKLESMISEAEKTMKGGDRLGTRTDRSDGKRRAWDSDREYKKVFNDGKSKEEDLKIRGRDSSRRRDECNESDAKRCSSSERSRGRFSEKDSEINRRKHDDRNYNSRNADRYKKSSRYQRPRSDSESESSLSRSPVRTSKDDISDDKRPSNFHNRCESYKSSEGRTKYFMKPGEDFDMPDVRDKQHRSDRSPVSQPRWKKNTAVETSKDERNNETKKTEQEIEQHSSSGKNSINRQSKSSSSDSSSHSSESEEESSDNEQPNETCHVSQASVLSEEQLNELAAKILRAEIMGDDATAASLKQQLETAREAREASKSGGNISAPEFAYRRREEKGKGDQERKRRGDEEDTVVVLSRTSKGGLVRPVLGSSEDRQATGGKRRKRNVATHDGKGERTIYFDDDDKFDLKTMVEQEKSGTAEDQNSMFARLAGRSTDKDLDVDDLFVSKAARKQSEELAAAKDRASAIFEHKKINASMEKCHRCFEKVPKHLIIAIGTKSYLCLPNHRSLAEGHCFIVPMQHVSAATSMDEDVWLEMQLFRKCLVQMFAAEDQDMVVMETVMHLKHFPHTAIECVPLDREIGDLAPIYFKKAIQDAGPEWSDNKKLHSLSNKDVRHVIPKGFPYFSVDFGLQGGYGTVIEDENSFPSYFGREIVGGMLDAEPVLWRKPHKESFEDQRQKVLRFSERWQPFDWTQKLVAGS